MADLFDRLFPANREAGTNIPIHAFVGAITDYAAGYTTKAQIISAWTLDSEAQADLTAVCNKIDALSTTSEKVVWIMQFDAVMLLAASGLKYATKSSFATRLGI